MKLAPALSIAARFSANRDSSLKPERIFTVTGTVTRVFIARTISKMRRGVFSRLEPAPFPTTVFEGQPQLRSMRQAPRRSSSRAREAAASGSSAMIWAAWGMGAVSSGEKARARLLAWPPVGMRMNSVQDSSKPPMHSA